jgi:hypothetical protein
MAEREGFEPSVELSPHTHLAGERLQPTRPSLRGYIVFIVILYLAGTKYGKLKHLAATGGGSRIRTHGPL